MRLRDQLMVLRDGCRHLRLIAFRDDCLAWLGILGPWDD
jgi:hypothetical protein